MPEGVCRRQIHRYRAIFMRRRARAAARGVLCKECVPHTHCLAISMSRMLAPRVRGPSWRLKCEARLASVTYSVLRVLQDAFRSVMSTGTRSEGGAGWWLGWMSEERLWNLRSFGKVLRPTFGLHYRDADLWDQVRAVAPMAQLAFRAVDDAGSFFGEEEMCPELRS